MAELFSGNKELFKDLYIYDKYDFTQYPVLRINLSGIKGDSYASFSNSLCNYFTNNVAPELELKEIEYSPTLPSSYLANTLIALYRKTKKKIVVLIDEYDYPLIDDTANNADKTKIANDLGDFYVALKNNEEKIHFCFLTGVFQYSTLSLSSKFNNLEDISSYKKMAGLSGYTKEELNKYFSPYLDAYVSNNPMIYKSEIIENLRRYYCGYRFSALSDVLVYNPVSIGMFFNNLFDYGVSYENFWLKTGSMKIVKDIIKNNIKHLAKEQPWQISASDQSIFEVTSMQKGSISEEYLYVFLLQTGYLTISGKAEGKLLLKYPNKEVAAIFREEINKACLKGV